MSNPEQLSNHENQVEVHKPTVEHLEKITETPESTPELSPRDVESRAEKARKEALESAVSVESGGKEKAEKHDDTFRRGPINKKQREKSFSDTMHRVRSELPVVGRTYSKVIHNKYVEKPSEVAGNTLARPNALLAGAFMAFLLTLIVYTTAKTFGYTLSGFETIASFAVGWTLGIVYDYLRLLFTGKKF